MKKKLHQTLRKTIMRLFSIMLLLCLGQSLVWAENSDAQNLKNTQIKLTGKKQKVSTYFKEIEKQSNFSFSYESNLDLNQQINLSRDIQSLEQILITISKNTNLKFKQINQTLAVSKKLPASTKEIIELVSISGQITDMETGEALPGVNVILKGKNRGTVTDLEGVFQINAEQGDILLFSYIGYKKQEVVVLNQQVINIQLVMDDSELQEVIVTALGIKREEKALGYATQKITGDELLEARPNNWSDALIGKVAGLNVLSAGSGPMNSSQISLRGDNSLNPNGNFALIVVDGVPLNSGLTSSGVGSAYGAGSGNDVPVDFGNGIADLNPDDIANITVLKGASATALYGSRAANGALIITTKTGQRTTKGIGVTVNTNISFNDVLKWPDRQYEYGQGTGRAFNQDGELYYSYGVSEDGASTGGTSSAFGPRFDGQYYYQFDPATQEQSAERQVWRPYEDNITGFWRTGSTITNSVALEGSTQTSAVRASFTHTKNEWIMPNTGFERYVAALSVNQAISSRLSLTGKVNYINKRSDNLPATGYNNQSIAYFMIFQNPNISLDAYRPIWREGMENVQQLNAFSGFIDNPYLIAYEMTNSVNNNSVIGNLSATYDISPKLDLMVRSGIALSQEERVQRRPYSTANFQRGYYREQDITNYEINTDFLFSYHEKLGNKMDLRISAGGNQMIRNFRMVSADVDGLVIPGVFKLSNGINNPMLNTANSDRVINSLFGLASWSYDEKIYVDITGRNDWSSTLPVQNRSFFYPSISSSFIVSDMIDLPAMISFAKVRLSGAQVGNDTEPYRTSKYYGQSDFPGSASVPTLLYNTNFKPEISTSYEAGLELIFFNRRLGADLNFYHTVTNNQILEVPIDITSGFARAILNAGRVRNQGVELVLNGSPVVTKLFKWNTFITWAKNDNRVLELADEVDGSQVIGSGGTASVIARVGGTTGDIYGFGFERAPDGQIIYNATTGLPVRPQEIQYIGNAYADWKGGWRNEFTFRNIRASVLFDGQYGGIVYSQTHHKMAEQGKLKSTLRGREEGYIIGDGVVDNGDGTFSPNTTQVDLPTFYGDYYRRANIESNSFDASFIKLRELRMEYNIPTRFMERWLVERASIALYGRDLAMWTNFPMFDPETAALNGGTLLPGIEMGQLPTPRTFGVNVTLQF